MPFEKGNRLGKGAPPLPPEVKEARRFNQQELDLALSKLLTMTPAQLKDFKNDPEATAVELALAAILIGAINKGDQQKLDFLFNRKLGKVKEQVEASGSIKVVIEDYLK